MVFSAVVGFWEDDVEISPGVWRPSDIIERTYKGTVVSDRRRFQSDSSNQNDTFTVGNRIEILSDLYSRNNWPSIKYVVWKGVKWKVTSVEVNYPRLILDLGGVYNENTT